MPTTSNLPFYKQAKNLTSCVIYAGNAVNGVVTWGTGVNIAVFGAGTATFKGFAFDPTTSDVSLRPADSTMENMATEYQSFTASVSELAPANGPGNINLLAAGNDYFKVIVRFAPIGGTVANESAVALIAKRTGNTTGIAPGENVDTLSLVPCNIPPYIGLASGIPSAIF